MNNDDVTTSEVVEALKRDIARLEKENDLLKAAPVAVPDGWREMLKVIDIKAQAGLCQMSHAGTREFLKDIRTLVAAALQSAQAPAAQAQELPAELVEAMDDLCADFHKYQDGDPSMHFVVLRGSIIAALTEWQDNRAAIRARSQS